MTLLTREHIFWKINAVVYPHAKFELSTTFGLIVEGVNRKSPLPNQDRLSK